MFNFRAGLGEDTITYVGMISGLSEINVDPGNAYFDGSIENSGNFNLNDDGRFILSSNQPSQVNVDTYTQMSGGILAYEVTPEESSAGEIVANSVNLDGTIEVIPLAGFYDTTTHYENVVVSTGGNVNGAWDNTFVDSPFFSLDVIYEADNTIDLDLLRRAFDDFDGLTRNQRAVAGGLENAYEPSIEGTEFEEALGYLFMVEEEDYPDALDSIGGAEYAQGLQSLIFSQRMFRRSIFDHLGNRRGDANGQEAWLGRFDFATDQLASAGTGEDGALGASPGATQTAAMARKAEAGTLSFWARAYGDFTDLDGDEEADSFDGEQYGFAMGADVRVIDDLVLGAAGGYSDNEMDFSNGNSIDYDGVQVALYGSFDPGAFYLDAMASYGWYDNTSSRQTFVPALQAEGNYDSEVYSLQAETGYAFDVEPATVTPFAAVRYTHAEMDSFTESGAGGFNLSVDDSDAESLTTTLGVDLSAQFQAGDDTWIVPQLRLGWEHEFDDAYQTVGAHFAGIPASAFTVIGSEVAKDSAIVGAGVTVTVGETWELFLDYDGKLNQDVQQHAVSGGVRLSW